MGVALLLATAGCSGNGALPPAAPVEMPPTEGSGAQSPGGAEATGRLTEGQIVNIIFTADSNEISEGQSALAKAQNPKVRKFAEKMMREHLDHKKKASDLAQKLSIAPAESPVSQQLSEEGNRTNQAVGAHQGADFDRAYMEAQVKEHLALIDLLDSKMIPAAQSPDLRSALQDSRSMVQDHLKEAQDIQKDLLAGK